MADRLEQQLNFLHEIDALKTIFRRTNLIKDPTRLENTAEHSWHIALYTIILAEYANEPINVGRVVKMLLIHDIVEIDAGDTFCYDDKGNANKVEREQQAAERLFGLLPQDQGKDLRALWDEFEEGQSTDAKFAIAIDRIQPLLHNYETDGGSWTRHNIQRHQVEQRMAPIRDGSSKLADVINTVLDDAVLRKLLGNAQAVKQP